MTITSLAFSYTVPVLETDRLRLRPHRADDVAAMTRLWTDPVVTRFIGRRPHTQEEIWQRMLRYAGHWQWLGYGYWAVEERDGGRVVGDVGFADYRRALPARYDGLPEIGWVLHPDFHGRGYAREAVTAAYGWADSRLPAAETFAIIDPENAASLAVAAHAGLRRVEEVTYRDHPTLVLTRTRQGEA